MILSKSVGHRIISGNTEISLPAQSPDKAQCDFCLLGICKAEIRRVKPKTLKDLIKVVNEFVASLDAAEDRRAVTAVSPMAELCFIIVGGRLWSKLQKYKRGTIEEL